MKKNVLFIMIFAGVLLVYGCNRQKECQNHMVYNSETNNCECKSGMVYNRDSKNCDCIQTHNQNNLPFLSEIQYNSWEDVVANYEYYVKSSDEYPYFHQEGKTFNVCGWIRHHNGQAMEMTPDSAYAAFGLSADSSEAFSSPSLYSSCSHLEAQTSLLESVDMKEKCYITGTLSFEPNHWFIPIKMMPESCFCPEFVLRVTEIHN
jgi:hypothetical protein